MVRHNKAEHVDNIVDCTSYFAQYGTKLAKTFQTEMSAVN